MEDWNYRKMLHFCNEVWDTANERIQYSHVPVGEIAQTRDASSTEGKKQHHFH